MGKKAPCQLLLSCTTPSRMRKNPTAHFVLMWESHRKEAPLLDHAGKNPPPVSYCRFSSWVLLIWEGASRSWEENQQWAQWWAVRVGVGSSAFPWRMPPTLHPHRYMLARSLSLLFIFVSTGLVVPFTVGFVDLFASFLDTVFPYAIYMLIIYKYDICIINAGVVTYRYHIVRNKPRCNIRDKCTEKKYHGFSYTGETKMKWQVQSPNSRGKNSDIPFREHILKSMK